MLWRGCSEVSNAGNLQIEINVKCENSVILILLDTYILFINY